MMPQFIKLLCFTFLLCNFALSAQAESLDEQAKAYCEVVRTPSKKVDPKLAGKIFAMADTPEIHFSSDEVYRYPALASLLLWSGYPSLLNTLDKLGPNKRVQLCQALETERQEMIALTAEEASVDSLCESNSQPTHQPNEMLVSQNAELASKMKLTIKPDIAARYPALINQVLTAESSKFCNATQGGLDSLDCPENRIRLCKILEKERLSLKRLDIQYKAQMAIIDIEEIK